jgi:hypothetical protein
MPYLLRDVAHHDGVQHDRHSIVSDEVGEALRRAGHGPKLTRFAHDDDLCAGGGLACPHLSPADALAEGIKGAAELQQAATDTSQATPVRRASSEG